MRARSRVKVGNVAAQFDLRANGLHRRNDVVAAGPLPFFRCRGHGHGLGLGLGLVHGRARFARWRGGHPRTPRARRQRARPAPAPAPDVFRRLLVSRPAMADADEQVERLASNLARNLKYVREQRGLTQGQLAKLSGVPRSTVANVETGAANPTLVVLARLARALQLSLEELLSAPRGRTQLYKKGALPILERGRGGRGKATVQKLLPHPIPGMEIDRIDLEPGARMPGVPHRPGTQEYLCCERGRIVLYT